MELKGRSLLWAHHHYWWRDSVGERSSSSNSFYTASKVCSIILFNTPKCTKSPSTALYPCSSRSHRSAQILFCTDTLRTFKPFQNLWLTLSITFSLTRALVLYASLYHSSFYPPVFQAHTPLTLHSNNVYFVSSTASYPSFPLNTSLFTPKISLLTLHIFIIRTKVFSVSHTFSFTS